MQVAALRHRDPKFYEFVLRIFGVGIILDQVLRPKLKVLFTSGYPAEVIARRGVLERDVAYLPKPFSPEALASKVREVLSDADASPQKEGSSA